MSSGCVASPELAAGVVQQTHCPGGKLQTGGADSNLQGAINLQELLSPPASMVLLGR